MKLAAPICLAWLLLLLDTGSAAPSARTTITCPLAAEATLKFVVPGKMGDLPKIDFDYPSKVTRFAYREGELLLLVAMDEEEASRVRIVISAQFNKAKKTYDGQEVVDFGGNELQLDSGPISCKVTRG